MPQNRGRSITAVTLRLAAGVVLLCGGMVGTALAAGRATDAGSILAFVSPTVGYFAIFIADVNHGVSVRIAAGAETYQESPVWSLDGNFIAFVARDEEFQSEVYVTDITGTFLRNVSNHPGDDGSPTWSPDGRRIAFASERDGNAGIYVVDVSCGCEPVRLTDHPAPDLAPEWSPDGAWIAFTRRDGNDEVYVHHIDSGELRRVTENTVQDYFPAWSPNSRTLAFVRNQLGDSDIYFTEMRTGNIRGLTEHGQGVGSLLSWSPDGTQIAFSSLRDDDWEIYVISLDGTNELRLTVNIRYDASPAWSPDGTQIAFVSDRDGNSEIYVMNADGSNVRRITSNNYGDVAPVWRPG